MKPHQKFKEICVANGWKCTSQRLAVYHFVCDNLNHPKVDETWAAIKQLLPSVTRESVYRIMNEFVQAGILHRLDKIDSARYDSQTHPHGHFICDCCGEITDFALSNEITLPDTMAGEVKHIELRISGICQKCNP